MASGCVDISRVEDELTDENDPGPPCNLMRHMAAIQTQIDRLWAKRDGESLANKQELKRQIGELRAKAVFRATVAHGSENPSGPHRRAALVTLTTAQ